MCGKATLAIEVSSTSMNAASATVMAISHGFTLGFHFACDPAESGFSTVTVAAGTDAAGNVVSIADNSLLRGFRAAFCGAGEFWRSFGPGAAVTRLPGARHPNIPLLDSHECVRGSGIREKRSRSSARRRKLDAKATRPGCGTGVVCMEMGATFGGSGRGVLNDAETRYVSPLYFQ